MANSTISIQSPTRRTEFSSWTAVFGADSNWHRLARPTSHFPLPAQVALPVESKPSPDNELPWKIEPANLNVQASSFSPLGTAMLNLNSHRCPSSRSRVNGAAILLLSLVYCWVLSPAISFGQDTPAGQAQQPASAGGEGKLEAGLEAARKSAGQVTEALEKGAQDIGKTLDQSKTVQDAAAGLLKPIYDLSRYMAHPWFYWLAFALMVAGVVSFAGQIVLTKLLLIFSLHLSMKELLSDLLGLLISLVGLVLVTQAATENSTFSGSPAAVLSSAVVGVIAGVMFYLWGQSTEFKAARRPKAAPNNPPSERR